VFVYGNVSVQSRYVPNAYRAVSRTGSLDVIQ